MKTVTEPPEDMSKVVSVTMRDIYEKCDARDAECFMMGVGWVRVVKRQIISYEVEE